MNTEVVCVFHASGIRHSLRHTVTLRKITPVDTTDAYAPEEETYAEYSIRAYMQVLTLYDLTWLPVGLVEEGDARGYFLPSYTIGTETIRVEIRDIIVWDNVEWRVFSITSHYNELGQEVYREAYMRAIHE